MATEVEVIIDHAAIDRFRGWEGPLGKSFGRLEKETVFRQKAFSPKKTGHLAGSIKSTHVKYARGLAFRAGSNVKYALFMEQGTKAHMIFPKKAGGMLVFYWPKVGGTVYLRAVHHPGTRPYHYLFTGLERAMGVWNRAG